jgi:uncharacterized protein YbjT (DUF2867 family)
MKVLVCGANGCIGSAVTLALRALGHTVIEGVRDVAKATEKARVLQVDFKVPLTPAQWAARLRGVDAVVNAVGILMESRSQRFAEVHSSGPRALFAGAHLAGVKQVVQISALGVERSRTAYAASKLEADSALQESGLRHTIVRPSLVYGPRSQSFAVFKRMSRLPVIALPGDGEQALQPLHSYELAQMVCNLLAVGGANRIIELGGAQVLSYRAVIDTLRSAQGLRSALFVRVPLWLMRALAAVAERLPQQVLSRDGLEMLQQGCATEHNAAAQWLGRAPTGFAQGAEFELKPELKKHNNKTKVLSVFTHFNAIDYVSKNELASAPNNAHGSALRART